MIEPKLRFKADDGSQFPDWEKKKLEDVVEFLDGQRKPLEAGQRVSGKYPYYGASGIIDYVEDYIFDEELILLSEDGANILDRNYRVCFLAKGKYWVNNHAHVLRAMDGNVNGFICEQLETFDYRKYNSGGAQPKLNQATCRAIIMNMPSLPEQQKIAEFLSTIDTVIAKQKETVSAWEERKKGMMQKLFSQEVRFKADDGSDFPEWEEKKLGECCDILDSKRKPISKENRVLGKYAYYGSTNIQDYINEYLFDEPLVLLAEDAGPFDDFWNKAIAQFATGKFWVNNHAHVLRPHENRKYFFYSLEHRDIRVYINNPSRGKLNQEDMVKIPMYIPCLEEQQKIADCLSSLDEVIEKQKATLAAWEELKKGLLQQMFV